MGGRRTGVLAIGSSEGIALGNGGPLRSRALAENKFVGTACLVTANPSATLSQMSFDTRVIAALLWLFHVIISALILPARFLPTRLSPRSKFQIRTCFGAPIGTLPAMGSSSRTSQTWKCQCENR